MPRLSSPHKSELSDMIYSAHAAAMPAVSPAVRPDLKLTAAINIPTPASTPTVRIS